LFRLRQASLPVQRCSRALRFGATAPPYARPGARHVISAEVTLGDRRFGPAACRDRVRLVRCARLAVGATLSPEEVVASPRGGPGAR
jgi:hypothetical protein